MGTEYGFYGGVGRSVNEGRREKKARGSGEEGKFRAQQLLAVYSGVLHTVMFFLTQQKKGSNHILISQVICFFIPVPK